MATRAIGRKIAVVSLDAAADPTAAPVCHLPSTADIPQPAGPNLPAIPAPDGTIEGIMNSLNSLIQGYNALAGFGSGGPGSAGRGGSGGGFKTKDGSGKDAGRFVEKNRLTKKVRVTNPDDETQFVDVEVITSLIMTDTKTGETWVWTR